MIIYYLCHICWLINSYPTKIISCPTPDNIQLSVPNVNSLVQKNSTHRNPIIFRKLSNNENFKLHRFLDVMNITVRQNRQSGVARATCPD